MERIYLVVIVCYSKKKKTKKKKQTRTRWWNRTHQALSHERPKDLLMPWNHVPLSWRHSPSPKKARHHAGARWSARLNRHFYNKLPTAAKSCAENTRSRWCHPSFLYACVCWKTGNLLCHDQQAHQRGWRHRTRDLMLEVLKLDVKSATKCALIARGSLSWLISYSAVLQLSYPGENTGANRIGGHKIKRRTKRRYLFLCWSKDCKSRKTILRGEKNITTF